MKKTLLVIFVFIFSFSCNFLVFGDNEEQEEKKEEKLPRLESQIYFQNKGSWSYRKINIVKGQNFNTPLLEGEWGEAFINDFINKNILITLTCSTCSGETEIEVIENSFGEISITDDYGRVVTEKYRVWKIDKTPPVTGELIYTPPNDVWTNTSKQVSLSGKDNESWIVGEADPTDTCEVEGGCEGTLEIKDVAGNMTKKDYKIEKIDNTPPIIHVELFQEYGEIPGPFGPIGTQKVIITCEDSLSGCREEDEKKEFYFPLGYTKNECVKDIAGNETCNSFTTYSTKIDFSDEKMDWTNKNRIIYLNCQDNGSGCKEDKFTKIIEENIDDVDLKASDRAGNSITKHFIITKIDKIKPEISILSKNSYKASSDNEIELNFKDEQSGIDSASYKWNESCISGEIISGESVLNGDKINYTVSGKHNLYLCAKDKAGNIKEESKEIIIYPSQPDRSESTLEILDGENKYANNSDYIDYKLTLKDKFGNSIYGKKIISINQDCTNYTSCNTLKTNMSIISNPSGEDALIEYDYLGNETSSSGTTNFKVKSLAPGEFTSRFKVDMRDWGDDYNDTTENIDNLYIISSGTNKFKKPIRGELKIIEGGEKPEIGKQQEYQISLINTGALSGYLNGNLDINKDSIDLSTNGHIWRNFEVLSGDFGSNLNTKMGFSGSIDSEGDPLSKIEISLKDLDIKYKLDGKDILYNLDDFGISGCDISTLGLKVIGTLQGEGKSDLTGQDDNISDLSKSFLRSEIRKNAFSLIKGLSSGDTINGIKYIEGDVTISGNNLGYETLIVKDGNVFISGDLNTDNNKLGIIVLKDNYNVLSDYDKTGNVYVSKDVEEIKAIIYTDGTFRSTKSDGSNYTDSELSKKLYLKGSLFTKNTIGGAVKGNSNYLLPGGKITEKYDLAEKYDLNYIRKTSLCGVNNYSFLIEYNPSIQTNPPKGFSQK